MCVHQRLGNNVVVNGNENEVCSQPQTLPERGTLPIQCTRGNAAATGRFLTLYRQSNQPSSMYLCQVLAFLAGGCRAGDPWGLFMQCAGKPAFVGVGHREAAAAPLS